jgi:hypothetical protein
MSSANAPAIANDPLPSRRQFSLLSLLVVILVVCLALGYFGERRRRMRVEVELQRKRDEVLALRAELGQLEDDPQLLKIADSRLVHLRAVPTHERDSWAWRVRLPPEKSWRLGISQGERWDASQLAFLGQDNSSPLEQAGEMTIEAWLAQHSNGQFSLIVRHTRGRRLTVAIPSAGLMVLRTQSGAITGTSNPRVAGFQKQDIVTPGTRVELLHWQNTLAQDFPAGEHHKLPGENQPLRSYGVSIYIEEIRP